MSKNKWKITGRECPHCESSKVINVGSKPKQVLDIDDGEIITVDRESQRQKCKTCYKTWTVPHPEDSVHAKVTVRLEQYILTHAEGRRVKPLSIELGIHHLTVAKIYREARADKYEKQLQEMIA